MQVVHTVTTVLQNHHIKTTENYEVRHEVICHVISQVLHISFPENQDIFASNSLNTNDVSTLVV